MNHETIREKITSENQEILKRSISFVDSRITLMRERAKLAETRATAMLVVSGLLAGFVVNFGKAIYNLKNPDFLLFFILYLSSIFLFVKAIFYAVRVLGVLRGYELSPDLAFDLQEKSEIDALREELIWKIWEYWEILPLTTKKLFLLNRSQRNTISAIIILMFLGGTYLIKIQFGLHVPTGVTVLIIIIMLFLVIFFDVTMERFGKVWHKQ